MANWIIRANAPSVAIENKRVVLKSRRRVSIGSGDDLVLLSSELVFVDKARVLQVREASAPSLAPSDEGEQKRWWEIEIDEWKSLAQEVDLTDASTSLTFIHNWRQPKVHVRLAYRRLPDEDLATLERGELFVARETYLTFLDALPTRLVQLFLAENPLPSRSWRVIDYAERARALITFIEGRVLSVGRIALATQHRWDALLARTGSTDSQRLYVWDEAEADRAIDFTSQVQAFRALLPENVEDSDSPSQLADIAELLASRQGAEERFEALFRDRIDE